MSDTTSSPEQQIVHGADSWIQNVPDAAPRLDHEPVSIHADYSDIAAAATEEVEQADDEQNAPEPAVETEQDDDLDDESEEMEGKDEQGEAGPEQSPDGLFDRSQYDDPQLQLAKIDDQGVDRLRISFAGSVDLDRSSPADVALFRKLRLGRGGITLRVEGVVKKTSGATLATAKEGEGAELVLAEKQIKVTTVYVPAAEEL